MDDPTIDLAKSIPVEILERVYDDAASPAAKQLGYLAGDTMKALRLFTAPIQLLAAAQDRLYKFLDHVRGKVPPERQTEAPAHIAGPVMMNMRFIEDDNPIRELYAELLAKAIDKERQKEAHPGFVKIIEQMSPEEAEFLSEITHAKRLPTTKDIIDPDREAFRNFCASEPRERTVFSKYNQKRMTTLMQRLESLGIITIHPDGYPFGSMFTGFGTDFARICVPRK